MDLNKAERDSFRARRDAQEDAECICGEGHARTAAEAAADAAKWEALITSGRFAASDPNFYQPPSLPPLPLLLLPLSFLSLFLQRLAARGAGFLSVSVLAAAPHLTHRVPTETMVHERTLRSAILRAPRRCECR
ncbi:hypothetical protein FIBSPDRAFT_343964 [Athelia psychrophila]|uniref:Uncharacterized protein n=1 Tax=Athelia psychrophila TaxID=1759441 RepID=A0A167W584_9AGAM|nr:hypothetical protein FIBSPDRAFT_343964 [Fibularhizoctonia sp. CBS 109695]